MNRFSSSLVLSFLCFSIACFSQAGKLELGNVASPANGAILDLSGTASGDKGFLMPRMTQAQREALTVVASVEGLQVYQTDGARGIYFYDGVSWRPWRKPVTGTVDMTSGSVIERGEGFSVVNEEVGRDLVTFETQYSIPPMIMLTGAAIEGIPPVIPGDLCGQVMSNCTNVHLRYLNLSANGVDNIYEFQTGNNFCNASPGNLSTYKWGDPEWITPTNVVAGTDIKLNWNTPNNPGIQTGIYADWNQSGSFDDTGELIWEGSSPSNLAQNRTISVPASACTGFTALRVVTVSTSEILFPCQDPNEPDGETEQIEMRVVSGSDCSGTYAERQTTCNVAGLNNSGFRVECSDINGDKVAAKYYFKIIDNQ